MKSIVVMLIIELRICRVVGEDVLLGGDCIHRSNFGPFDKYGHPIRTFVDDIRFNRAS